MRNRTRAIAVGVSLAASVLLLQGSALGAGTGNDRGGHTMTFHVLFMTPTTPISGRQVSQQRT